jgi:hypothetical protein
MKHNPFIPLPPGLPGLLGLLGLLGLAALCLSGCPAEPEPEGYGREAVITAVENSGPVYFSFGQGKTVAEVADDGWDLAFSYTRMIHTNSGDTAAELGSGGKGGVWAVPNATALNVAVSPADADFSLPLATDKSYWTSPAAEMGSPVLNRLNVISYVGYGSGDGSEAAPLTDYRYNAQAYYSADLSTMPPIYSVTQQVYLVRHGDGERHTKMHIVALETRPSTGGAKRVFLVRYLNL